MTTPYIGFGNDTLIAQPEIKPGDEITCPTCRGQHPTVDSTPPMMLSYKCGDRWFMAGLKGPGGVYRRTVGLKADFKGTL